MQASVIKPGLLVALRVTVKGGVSYRRVDTVPEHQTEDGGQVAAWETTREVADLADHEAAIKAQSGARSAVVRVCCASAFGLLCPSARQDDLQAAIREARAIAAAHNASSSLSRVEVSVLVGRVAQDDTDAVRAIGAEVRSMLEAMQAGIKATDPDAIREAASRARAIAGMLTPEAAGQVSSAIKEARAAARAIVKRVQKAGESAASVVAEISTRQIESARFAFLDYESAPAESVGPFGRGVDMGSESSSSAEAQGSPIMALPFLED